MATIPSLFSRGTAAARPASSSPGAVYFASDTQILSRYSGSAWESFGPALLVGDSGSGGTRGFAPAPAAGDAASGKFLKADGTWAVPTGAGNPELRGTVTAPINSQFAWVNQSSAVIRDDTDSVVLVGASTGSGANVVARVKTAPAAPYTITAFLLAVLPSKAFQSYGLCFRQTSDGKLHVLDMLIGAAFGNPGARSTKFTSATAFSADYVTVPLAVPMRWMRIVDDNTNRICSISADGVDWLQVHTVARTDFLTADQVGFCISTENSTTPAYAPIVRVSSWTQT